jgi:flagellar protein FlbD
MIELTRLTGQKIVINADLIEFIEKTPDTIICTTTGKRIMVQEDPRVIVDLIVAHKKLLKASDPGHISP